MRNKSIFAVVMVFIAAALLIFVSGAQAQTDTEEPVSEAPRTLAVNGNGIIRIEPDIAYLNIGVNTEGKDADAAVASNNADSQNLYAALSEAGVADRDIQTSNFSIYPRQDFDPEGKIIGITYLVNNTVSVTVRDLAQIGMLLDAAVQAGANNINGIRFDIEDREAAQQQAMVAAVENARERAEILAGAAGVELGAVMSIQTYIGGGYPAPYDKNFAMADGAGMAVAPGEMQISVDANVIYEIE